MEKFNAETGHAILKAAELDNSLQQLLLHAMPKMFEAFCASLRHCETFSPTPRCQCDLPVRRSSIKRGSSRSSTQREQLLECHSIPPFREQRWRLTTRSTGCSTGTRLRSDPGKRLYSHIFTRRQEIAFPPEKARRLPQAFRADHLGASFGRLLAEVGAPLFHV